MIYRTAEKPLRNIGGLCDCANIQYISDRETGFWLNWLKVLVMAD